MPNKFFGQNLQSKVKNRRIDHHHRILPIENSLGTKFQLKLKSFTIKKKEKLR